MRTTIIWKKSKEEVPHGQAVWAVNFIDVERGLEVVVLKSRNVGDFLTLRGVDEAVLARFQQKRYDAYPDFPVVVNWLSTECQLLWISSDHMLVDGRGRVVQDLGLFDERVVKYLCLGVKEVIDIPVQAFALALCGDDRDKLILYQPHLGRAIFIFTQSDSDAKPYRHQPQAYNLRSYY